MGVSREKAAALRRRLRYRSLGARRYPAELMTATRPGTPFRAVRRLAAITKRRQRRSRQRLLSQALPRRKLRWLPGPAVPYGLGASNSWSFRVNSAVAVHKCFQSRGPSFAVIAATPGSGPCIGGCLTISTAIAVFSGERQALADAQLEYPECQNEQFPGPARQ